MSPSVAIALVFFGCCSNVLFLEELVREHPKSGNLITFSAFVFNALEGLIFTSRFFTKKAVIPIRYYIMMVSLFFICQTLNNYVLGLNISMPLQMIFRAGSLVANLILGCIILHRRYKRSKYLSVIMITLGIILCTMASSSEVKTNPSHTDDPWDYSLWCLGVALMVVSLFLSAWMGVFQEQTYTRFGKHPSEALFYNHLLPLPGFLLLATDITSQAKLFNASAPMMFPVVGVMMPRAWFLLIFNTITQYICIRAVFVLTTECSSLTVTLVVTLRKFVSLIFSIIYFQNPFTVFHWIGATLVFGGTFIFTEVFAKHVKKEEKKK